MEYLFLDSQWLLLNISFLGNELKNLSGFTIKGNQGFIRIELQNISGFPEDTSHFGGYDAEGIVEIKSGNYYVLGELWFTTGNEYEFYKQLDKCYCELKGMATFWNLAEEGF